MTKRIEWTATVPNAERFRLRVCRPNSYDLRDATDEDLRAAGYVPLSKLTAAESRIFELEAQRARLLNEKFDVETRLTVATDIATGQHDALRRLLGLSDDASFGDCEARVEKLLDAESRAAEAERDSAQVHGDLHTAHTHLDDLCKRAGIECNPALNIERKAQLVWEALTRVKAELDEVRGQYETVAGLLRKMRWDDALSAVRSYDQSPSPHRAASELAVSARDNDGLRWEHCFEHEKLCYLRNGQHSTPKATSDDCCSKCGKRTNLVNDGDDGLGPVVCADCHTVRVTSDGERTALELAMREYALGEGLVQLNRTVGHILDHLRQQQRPAPVGLSQEQLRVLQSLEPFGAAKPAPAEQGGKVAGPSRESPLPWRNSEGLTVRDAKGNVVVYCASVGVTDFIVACCNRYHAEQGGKS